MARTLLYLVRHGEQDHAAGHAADGGLSDLGRQQAHSIGQRLRDVPFSTIHHSPLVRAAQTADVIVGSLPHVPRHPCDLVADRTPVPSEAQRSKYPPRLLPWLDDVPAAERDDDAACLQATVAHFGTTGEQDRHELLITHNFVIGWFVPPRPRRPDLALDRPQPGQLRTHHRAVAHRPATDPGVLQRRGTPAGRASLTTAAVASAIAGR